MSAGAGDLTESLTILTPTPASMAIASITRVGTTATVHTATPHGFSDGDYVTIAGAVPTAYNGEVPIVLVDATSFSYTVAGTPATPATGTITAVFTSDSQGGQRSGWSPLTEKPIWGRMRPLSARELIAAQAVQSTQTYEGTIYYRVPQDITPMMRVSWTPRGYTAPKVLEIHGVLPDQDEPRRFLTLDVGEIVGGV